jgi:hypothetical protein
MVPPKLQVVGRLLPLTIIDGAAILTLSEAGFAGR